MEELLKDADVVHHCMNDLSKAVKEKEKARFENLCKGSSLRFFASIVAAKDTP